MGSRSHKKARTEVRAKTNQGGIQPVTEEVTVAAEQRHSPAIGLDVLRVCVIRVRGADGWLDGQERRRGAGFPGAYSE